MSLHTSESFGFERTPAHLEDWISNYGCARADCDSGEYLKVSSLFDQTESDEYIDQMVDR